MNKNIQETIKKLPTNPGIYQYIDANGRLLYIGKAKNLKNRVKSYWRFTPSISPNPNQSSRIIKMLSESVSLEYIIVDTEEDALVLENSLIKQLKPKYNILLRDDKTYPYIYIDESQKYPRFEITRKVVKGRKISYYGPFPNGGRALIDAIYEIYPLVQKKSGLDTGKACLFHQIGKCLAPCEDKISSQEYHEIVDEVKIAISKREIIALKLEDRMLQLALQERFEEAAKIRDQINTIKSLKIKSNIDFASELNLDIFAIHSSDSRGVVVKMFMRDGKIVSSTHSYFNHSDIYDTSEAYRQILLDFYNNDLPFIPSEILVADTFDSMDEVSQAIKKILSKNIVIKKPIKGDKARLISLAKLNAEELLKKSSPTLSVQSEIARLFDLDTTPSRVEVFDNSHMMGVATVGAMVVWQDSKWDKKSYRRYELKAKDEYGQMREMLSRRIARFDSESTPDLWVLDGGRANLNLALSLLIECNINLPVIAIAKEKLNSKAHRAKGAAKDLIYTTDEIFELKSSDKRLQWIQLLRDESHRYVITYHQNKKRKDDTQISLLSKKGIGKATVKKLIDYFGTFEGIKNASYDDIEIATNKKIAKILTTKN